MTPHQLALAAVSSLAVIACGGGQNALSDALPLAGDAPGPDGAPGADGAAEVDGALGFDAAPDAPSASATVVVTKAGAPSAGVTVVFQDAAGGVLGTTVTGADGTGTGPIVAGGQVTTALGAAGARHLVTYVGVEANDVLQVAERADRPVSITLASGNPGGGISVVAGNFNCSTNASSAGTVLVTLSPECITGPTFPVLSTLTYAGDRYYSFKRDVTPAASGTTMVSGLSAWTPGNAFPFAVTNAPNLANPRAYLGQIANQQAVALTPETAFVLTAGAGMTTFSVAGGYAEAYQGEVQFRSAVGTFDQHVAFSKRIAGNATAQTLDLAGGVLPLLTTASATNADPARPVITWAASASLAGTDGGVVELAWNEGSEVLAWTFVVPPGTLSITAPKLPAQLSAYAPTAASQLRAPAVAFVETDLLAGYAAARAQAASFGLSRVPLGKFNDVLVPALSTDGTIRVTALAP